jgi:CDP-diacylglycerol--glycerol-3-phosphate 3-phosphatidyltransferase
VTAPPVDVPLVVRARHPEGAALLDAPVLAVPRVSPVNLPNALTLGRLFVVPVFAVLLLVAGDAPGVRLLLAGLFVLACVTDLVDGHLARSRGQVTDFGVMADPIADKALVGSALVGLSLLGALPWWATALVLGREVGVTLLRVAVRRHGLMPATRGGKLKTLSQNAAVTLYLLPLTGLAASARVPVLVLAVACTVVTGIDYAVKGWQLRRSGAVRTYR